MIKQLQLLPMDLENLDLYGELGVTKNASEREIITAYRKKALKYHPDKNPLAEAKHKFQVLTAVYTVLSDKKLREEYEEVQNRKQSKDEGLSKEILRFREKLRKAEAEQADLFKDAGLREHKIQLLQKEAQDLRYEFERQRTVQKSGYTSFRDMAFTGRLTDLRMDKEHDRVVEVKWKLREEPEAQISANQLSHIMAVFGPVEGAMIKTPRKGYVYGNVEYQYHDSALEAAEYDYRQSARLWDHTGVRKLASLLRGCKLQRSHVPRSSYAGLVGEQL